MAISIHDAEDILGVPRGGLTTFKTLLEEVQRTSRDLDFFDRLFGFIGTTIRDMFDKTVNPFLIQIASSSCILPVEIGTCV